MGGTWVYDDNVGCDVHSSMYKSLKTNLPKEVMAFPDFPFPSEMKQSFLHHTEVTRCDSFKLLMSLVIMN